MFLWMYCACKGVSTAFVMRWNSLCWAPHSVWFLSLSPSSPGSSAEHHPGFFSSESGHQNTNQSQLPDFSKDPWCGLLDFTFFSWLSRSTGTAWWPRCSLSVHSRHTHVWSLLQNSSRSLWCRLHIRFSSIATGLVSLWIFKVATRRCGSRWLSQYEARHARQDFTAFDRFPVHTSQYTKLFARDKESFCLLRRIFSNISLAKEFSQSSGRPSKAVWHLGQLTLALSQWNVMQLKQKLWPQGMETGSQKTFWQMKHWNCTSDSRTVEDMTWEIQNTVHLTTWEKMKRLKPKEPLVSLLYHELEAVPRPLCKIQRKNQTI